MAMTSSASVVDSVVSAGVVRRQLKAAVEGRAPWNVRLGHGTSVFFDFGDRERSEVAGTPDRGSDQLWVYSSSWRLFGMQEGDAGSGDDGSAVENALQQCIGRTVGRVRFDADLNLTLHFERPKMTFRTLRHSTTEDAWTLFRGSSAYSLAGDGGFLRESPITR
jgi:hypothetical protein